jgi:hypothetical protein
VAESLLPHLNTVAVAFSLTLLVLAVGLTASAPSAEVAASTPIEAVASQPQLLEASLASEILHDHSADLNRSTTLLSDAHWHVSHTHPGSGEIHVEAAFDRPTLLSVRRDVVTMRPVSNRSSALYSLP